MPKPLPKHMPKGRRPREEAAPGFKPFVERLNGYLADAGLSQPAELHKALEPRLKLTRAAVSLWLRGDRTPGPVEIEDLGLAIIDAMRSKGDRESRLVAVLTDLFEGAGLVVPRPRRDLVWQRLESGPRTLRYGWAECPPFACRDDSVRGFTREIAELAIRHMGAVPESVQCEWSDLVPKLVRREVDMIAPLLMTVPTRLHDLRFTRTIGVMAEYQAIVPKAGREKACTPKGELKPESVICVSLEGEVGQLFTVLTGGGPSGALKLEDQEIDYPSAIRLLEQYGSQDPAMEVYGKRVPCIVTERLSCRHVVTGRPKLSIANLPESLVMRYPLAFGVPREEHQLRVALNTVITILRHNGEMCRLLTRFREQFPELAEGVTVERGLERQPQDVATWLDRPPARGVTHGRRRA